jgi:hypothetical protein
LNNTPRTKAGRPQFRYPAAAALALTTLLLAGCSSGGQPLDAETVQEGVQECAQAPNPSASAVIPAWNSPVRFSLDWYENTSAAPVTIESVSLIDPHNLVLRGAVIYQGTRLKHSVILSDGWKLMGRYADPDAWAHRQSVPGAVIPAQTSQKATPATDPAEYDVILDISAKTPAGGYASGQQVTYKQGTPSTRSARTRGTRSVPQNRTEARGATPCKRQSRPPGQARDPNDWRPATTATTCP